jgi:hypothetical protein
MGGSKKICKDTACINPYENDLDYATLDMKSTVAQ